MTSSSVLTWQLVVLAVTALIYASGYYASVRAMGRQAQLLQAQMRSAAHADLFARLFDLYRLQIERPVLAGALDAAPATQTFEQQTFVTAITDLLYLMHVGWGDLDPTLQQTWRAWASRLVSSESFDAVVVDGGAYPVDFLRRLTAAVAAVGPTARSFR